MALSGSVSTGDYQGRYLKLSWTATQDVSTNKSTISWTLKGAGTASSSWYMAGNFTVVIGGTTVYDKDSDYRIKLYNGTKVASGTTTISHGTDGKKSFSVSVKAGIYTYAKNVSGSKTFTLDTIPRAATISSAPNFNDESNPVLTYSNPAGSAVSSLQACIANSDGSTIYAAYRDITKTGTSYTFNLTDTERTALRKACASANSMTVRFYVKTVIGGETFRKYSAKTLSIINATPTLSPTVVDTDSKMIELTGSSSKIVRYFSDVKVTIGAAAKKEATVSSKSCVNGSTTKTADGTFSNITSNSFVFSVKDSRGNTASKTLTPTMVNYVKLTCAVKDLKVSTGGVMNFSVEGNCFNGSFGAVTNTLAIQYRYKAEGGTYSDWITTTATKSGNTYSASGTVSGLDYKSTYVFQARAADSIYDGTYQNMISTSEKRISAKPVYHWSGEDFAIEVPVSLFILQSPNGTNYQITVNDSGGLVSTAITI